MAASSADHSLPLSREVAQAVRSPTLLVDAVESPPRFRAICDVLEQCIPGARRLRFEGAGHFLTMTHADEFNAIAERFFDEAGGVAQARYGRIATD